MTNINWWKMCLRTTIIVLVMGTFFSVQAGRFKKTGVIKHLKNNNPIKRNVSLNFGLWPTPFNLATKAVISANATCGENGREEFCRMIESGKGRCGICDSFGSDPAKKHPINYAIDGSNRWWQSPALFYGKKYEYVTITIDLKQVYQITDVIIRAANSLRPGTWILERSLDGSYYQVWQYFARSDRECLERFGIPGTKGKPHYFTDSEVICTSFYSKLTPMENGEVHTSLVNGRPGVGETSPELLRFTKARYVRLRLMGLRGAVEPLPRWFSQDVLWEKRLFYTIRDISIIGYCVCNGHAESCRHNVASGHPECECLHHACGSNCDRCCPMYNQRIWGPGSSRDAHQCLPCNCHGHATSCHYDENVDKAGLSMDINGNYQGGGVCDNCTGFTTGINCERCIAGYYRTYGEEIFTDQPCTKCACETPGSTGTCVQEGEAAGRCHCLPGYIGEKCEICDNGFKGWPRCESCPCDSRGTLQNSDCESNCVCKTNVDGNFCDKCRPGYFALNSENPDGCIKCYCSGVTTLCESALQTPKKIQTLNNWLITNERISEVVRPTWDNKGLFSIGNYELQNSDLLYWLAPKIYLGNKLGYYSSVLTFKVHWVIMRGDTSGKPTTGPNVIITGGNNIKIAFGNDSYLSSNETFKIKLKENNWYRILPTVDNIATVQPVNRVDFLNVLSNISHILLRATFHSDQIESLLEEATMYSEDDAELEQVEKCLCPSGYTGLSCESCDFGYVRITTNSSSESYCGKCDCNGHSKTCNPDTGECFCEHNTAGENCERCKPGFYGNPLKATKDDCKKCACPLENEENNFSPSCQVDYLNKTEGEGGYVCTQCPKGYTGDHCEICDDGYFGNPMLIGEVCKPCACNGDPCDKVTGQCLSCKGNTEGWRCEKCKKGYYGNALTSNCVSCQCDPIGSVSKACNEQSGQCSCKERFTGRTCNKCELGYGNVTALCAACSCNTTGSVSNICDPQTALCECKKGVDGFHCDACQNLHYGFSETGCEECNCDKYGSKIQACDQKTGRCICKSHYEGAKCNLCSAGYWKSNSICIPCNCNKHGSRNENCNPDTGQCFCKSGVYGKTCDSCQANHYGNVTVGCKVCEPCFKKGHICHPENGYCVCPNLTEGPECENCVANAWNYKSGIGCKFCNCFIGGSLSQQCHTISGHCSCREGFEGDKCDKCSYGYHNANPNYLNCQPCNCNVAGTLPEDCNYGSCKCSLKGCRCKANVEGLTCNQCKKQTFGIDVDHPDGCIDCFCSGRSSTCTASTLIWNQIRTDQVQAVSSQKCVNKIACWILPDKFTGDLMTSYGGYLRISPNYPDHIIYLTGNGITLESFTTPTGEIKFTEIYWKMKFDSNPPKLPKDCTRLLTRPCLMIVLQNVSKIQIEPKNPRTKLEFEEVILDKISNIRGIPHARLVENCTCPKEYSSSSCQDPNIGYYRYYPKEFETQYSYIDKILGVSKPCRCNNRSSTCDKTTGHCLKCEDHTTGPHCEYCAEGYYRDPYGNCSPCPCPSQNQNFAKNCSLVEKTVNQFMCICKPGYSGEKCNQCEDGYWGNPQEITGSCQPCYCNPHGSNNLICNKLTGQCYCNPGFMGDKCSKCSLTREVIQNGTCIPCDECTQILFDTISELSNDVNSASDLFKDGLGPPWYLLNSTGYQYEFLSERFKEMDNVKNFISGANIEKLEEKVENMNEDLLSYEKTLSKQTQMIESVRGQSAKISKNIDELENNLADLINKLDKFGKSHINADEALLEARKLQKIIVEIFHDAPKSGHYQNVLDKCQTIYNQATDLYRHGLNSTLTTREELNHLNNRISSLVDELNRTDLLNKLAKNKNNRNVDRIDSLRRTINQMNNNNSIINEKIMKLLKKIDVINGLLQDMKNTYELLATKGLENVTKSLHRDDVHKIYDNLSAVREHVKDLQNKIKSYQSIFDFTPEEWTKIDASGAYNDIAKTIANARKEADEAKNMSIDALNTLYPRGEDSLPDRTNLAKAFSDRIQKRIMNLNSLTKDFKDSTEKLDELKDNILSNGKSNNELNSVLRNLLVNLSEQSELFERISKAKADARNVSSSIMSIDQRLIDTNISVQYELSKAYEKYVNLSSCEEIKNLNKNINETKKNISKIYTSLNHSNALDGSKCVFNTTEKDLVAIKMQINRLNSIIQDANDRVEGIEYGVNIRECRRRYKLKSDIFRSLEIHFKCDVCVLFNLTNSNNEIIIYYEDNKVHVMWKNQKMSVNGSNTISVSRSGSIIRIETEKEVKFITDGEPLQIENEHMLQVGGFQKNGSNEACLRKIRINGQTIGLWKFFDSYGNCSGCYNRNNTNNDGLINVFFNGNGYRKVLEEELKNLNPQEMYFRFSFVTFDENSLMFLAQDKQNQCSFVALNMKDGFLELNVRHVNGQRIRITSKEKYNKGVDTTLELSMKYERRTNKQTYFLNVLVPEKEEPITRTANLEPKDVYKIKKSEIFVGGISSTFNNSCTDVGTTSFLGNLKVQAGPWVVGNQNSVSTHIEPALTNLEFYNAWFSGLGFIELQLVNGNFSDSQLTFVFKPVHVDDNYIINVNNKVDIYLKKSFLTLKTYKQEEIQLGSTCANNNYFIYLTETGVRMDNIIKNFTSRVNFLEGDALTLYLGNHDSNTNRPGFVGGLSDIFIDNRPILFNANTVKKFENVEIGRYKMLPKRSCKNITEMQNTERYFHAPNYKTEPQAFKFGDKANSFVFIKNIISERKFTLEFKFRTFYPNGLLFISNSISKNATLYTALEIQGGDIRLQVHGRKSKQLGLGQRMNDGAWHSVQVEQNAGKKKWRLVVKVDKKWKIKERLPRNYFNTDLYFGGISPNLILHRKLKNKLHPFRGCIGSLKINKNPQIVKNNNNVIYSNIGQCFQKVEEGAYFGGDAFAVYKYSFKVNNFLELSFEFKTSELNGILLSVSNYGNSPALSVELQNGAVVMTIDMGNGVVSQVTNSLHADATLTNNEWHNITALYSSSELTVNVDGIRKSWVQSDISSTMDEIEAPLYVGGLPNNAPSGTLKIKENFKGCIRKFKIEDNIMDWTDMSELNNVQLNSCLA